MIGMGGDKLLPAATGIEIDTALGEQLSSRRWEIFQRDYLPRLRPTRGARALVQRMKDDGLDLVVASSASGNELGSLMEAAQVADLFEKTTSSSDAEASKPDPDIVQAAVRKSRIEAELSGATAIYSDPADLLNWYDASPFAVKAIAGKGI